MRLLDGAVKAARRMVDNAPPDLPSEKLTEWRELLTSLQTVASLSAARARTATASDENCNSSAP